MKNIKNVALGLSLVTFLIVASAFSKGKKPITECSAPSLVEEPQNQMANMFVTHGHCSLPFAGKVENFDITIPVRDDLGNPLEDMQISFDVDAHSLTVCSRAEDLTSSIRRHGLFLDNNHDKISFKSTNVYTMGLDWYQVNGTLTIKGVDSDVKFFVSGIRDSEDAMATSLVIEGQFNLFDWGIDYDKIVSGDSHQISTKMMHLNMKVDLS